MPPLKGTAWLLLGGLLAAGIATPLLLGDGSLRGIDVQRVVSDELPAPPTLRLLSPTEGQGVGASVRIQGEAASSERIVLDVQWRLDGGRWESLPSLVAGAKLVPFSVDVVVPRGDHLVEARAYDGESFSLVSRVLFRADPAGAPPTVRIATPVDGQGVPAGEITLSGTVESTRSTHLQVRGAGRAQVIPVTPVPGAPTPWSATVTLPPGRHELVVQAEGGLPQRVVVAAGTPAPPTLRVLAPVNGSAFGGKGDPACPAFCILFSGLAGGAQDVYASLDGAPFAPLSSGSLGLFTRDFDGAWTWALPLGRLLAGEHHVAFAAAGTDGTIGSAPQHVSFVVRAGLGVRVQGDDAPLPTHSPLSFRVEGERLRDATWLLDGQPAGEGTQVQVRLPTPGLHVLTVQARDAQGRAALARLPLYALNQLPEAELGGPPGSVVGPVTLAARGRDPDGSVVAWRWDLGDGTQRTTEKPGITHAYARPGSYTVGVTPIDDQGGAGAPASLPVHVLNGAPQAAFTFSPAAPATLEPVTFTEASLDPENQIVARRWRFDDGSVAEGATVTHRFTTRGPHLVTLTVVDAEGASAAHALEVPVLNLPARVAFSHQPQAIQTGMEVLFLDRSVKEDGALVRWHWDFGHEGAPCEGACNPLHARNATGPRALHVFPAPGTYNVTLTVEDDAGHEARLALPVLVLDALPVVQEVAWTPETPFATQEVAFRALARDAEDGFLAHAWDFGEGNASDEAQPTHRYARSGLYQARLAVTDRLGQETTFPFLVHVLNAKPNATLRAAPGGLVAGRVSVLEADASDADGRIVRYRFDADNDGLPDCDGDAPRCAFAYPAPGAYVAILAVVDDEGGSALAELALDVTLPTEEVPAPAVLVESPAEGDALKGRVLVSGTAAGARPVRKVEIQWRNESWTPEAPPQPWMLAEGNATWRLFVDTRAFPDGVYDLVVRATDALGAAGETKLRVALQNEPRESLVGLEVFNPPQEPLRAIHDLRGSAWHPHGQVVLRYRVDEGPWRDLPGDPVGFTFSLDPKDHDPGPHVLTLRARHGLLEQRELEVPFRVADAPPALVVDEPPTEIAYGLLHARGRLVGEGKVLWRVDHDVWRELPPGKEWRLAHETSGLENGRHVLWLKAVSHDEVEHGEPRSWIVHVLNPPLTTEAQKRLLERSQAPPEPNAVDLDQVARDQSIPLPAWSVALGLAATALATRRRR